MNSSQPIEIEYPQPRVHDDSFFSILKRSPVYSTFGEAQAIESASTSDKITYTYNTPHFSENEENETPTHGQLTPINPFLPDRPREIVGDRFIPNRKSSRLSLALSCAHELESLIEVPKKANDATCEESGINVAGVYSAQVLGINSSATRKASNVYKNCNLFQYRESLLKNELDFNSSRRSATVFEADDFCQLNQKKTRKIPKVPYKVLDAPALQDDFYLNLIDWSSQNILAVGLSSCVYLWSAVSSKVTKLCDLGNNDTVTSVAWAPRVQIWDAVKLKKIRVLNGHGARVGTLAWNSAILASGSRDKSILYRDVRTMQNFTSKLSGHKQEVCGLKWSFDEQQLCSGGNDNKILIWSLQSSHPLLRFSNHTAAVKAIAWSPHQHGLLASGGGTADRTIRFWNTLLNQQVDCIDTGSQVCNLMFSRNVNELVSTHGYSLNQIIVWKYPSLERIVNLTGHTYRVLYLAMSPDGQTIVTGAGDETLRFWNVFPVQRNGVDDIDYESKLIPSRMDIR
eukprot:TRINITY_DN4929_c0_g1_i3.p1 TRINITY_DN4929_c0_g1~~TRINITY_DN4929_c0_g1_i3.p1  ORF type:complete len:513 (+),score=70.85 TRINITY_DN4929_c0_g1_i3:147-1685(+)